MSCCKKTLDLTILKKFMKDPFGFERGFKTASIWKTEAVTLTCEKNKQMHSAYKTHIMLCNLNEIRKKWKERLFEQLLIRFGFLKISGFLKNFWALRRDWKKKQQQITEIVAFFSQNNG